MHEITSNAPSPGAQAHCAPGEVGAHGSRRPRGWRAVPHALVLAGAWFAAQPALAQSVSPAFADLPGAAQERVGASIDAMLASKSVAKDRSANDLGWDCLAATELAARGDPRAVARLRLVVSELQSDLIKSAQGKPLGWTATIVDKRCPAGGYDAFQDRSCNPPDTVYAFQSGLGIACLARASKPLGDPALLGTARQVLAAWQSFLLPQPLCRDCLYFQTSSSLNDAGRFVRNMNVFMAFGAASLGAAGDAEAMQIGRRAMASELAESARGNQGYLGALDPQWVSSKQEADRIENHAASVAVLSMQMGALMGDAKVEQHAKKVWREWATCDNERCRSATCSYWAADPARCQATQTAAHCAFRGIDPLARESCQQYLDRVPAVGSFGIWALGVGGAPKPAR